MPHSLRVKIKGLRYKGIITEKDCDRLCKALEQEQKIGHCKDCKYFEYDSVAKVDGIPLIVAHEICSRWGDGSKTKEDGYCFLFEPKMSEIPTDCSNLDSCENCKYDDGECCRLLYEAKMESEEEK